MKKEYWIILIAYIGMQFSSLIGVPLLSFAGAFFGKSMGNTQIVAYWLVISFTITLLIALTLLRKEMRERDLMRDAPTAGTSVAWAIGGVFLAITAQAVAASIENMLGIEMGSENTQTIIRIIQASPIVVIVSSIIGPILEEIVFRKIIFGSLHKRINFFFSALISSVIFALAHFEFEHILLYSAMGFTFAFLYVKTKRIIVPIFAHVTMNTFVVILQLNQGRIENWLKEMEKIQAFIGGFL
ncbi:CPBP family intramembrane metalloprotease [Bacillus sp. FJAT-29790]|uniref:CPBP family intramembrane glutamic endopeptidase n=1 Tax=Bacillus sp. FJAT-29790 TaxID=1895002 RepID=UPI001C24FA14|nr:CPBP family intramembrane glutamic endopeptidase [Bacillus sp. FJAT-29790]MBU8881302.1 CPBP family intramembrane metalloprotease [Bacillus sp. FJAT-29790]